MDLMNRYCFLKTGFISFLSSAQPWQRRDINSGYSGFTFGLFSNDLSFSKLLLIEVCCRLLPAACRMQEQKQQYISKVPFTRKNKDNSAKFI